MLTWVEFVADTWARYNINKNDQYWHASSETIVIKFSHRGQNDRLIYSVEWSWVRRHKERRDMTLV